METPSLKFVIHRWTCSKVPSLNRNLQLHYNQIHLFCVLSSCLCFWDTDICRCSNFPYKCYITCFVLPPTDILAHLQVCLTPSGTHLCTWYQVGNLGSTCIHLVNQFSQLQSLNCAFLAQLICGGPFVVPWLSICTHGCVSELLILFYCPSRIFFFYTVFITTSLDRKGFGSAFIFLSWLNYSWTFLLTQKKKKISISLWRSSKNPAARLAGPTWNNSLTWDNWYFVTWSDAIKEHKCLSISQIFFFVL